MPELRQNIATKEWTIFSTSRKKRPHDFHSASNLTEQPLQQDDCPFCPGNEHLTPEEKLSFISEDTKKWELRVVANKYPALTMDGSYTRKKHSDFYREMDAIGVHEVVIETPLHNTTIGLMQTEQVRKVLEAYQKRYIALCNENHRFVTIFRNYGEPAGTSLQHPHSQIIATPIVPNTIRYPIEEAMRYYDDNGACVYCDMINQELFTQERIVFQGKKFLVFEPFAARMPFETWILPVTHSASYGLAKPQELDELADLLNRFLRLLYDKLNNPAYNYIIQSIPCNSERNQFYHWSLVILPRLTRFAGFELGSGMHINFMYPEECAAILRGKDEF